MYQQKGIIPKEALELEDVFKGKAKDNLIKGGKVSQEGLQISAKAIDTRKEENEILED